MKQKRHLMTAACAILMSVGLSGPAGAQQIADPDLYEYRGETLTDTEPLPSRERGVEGYDPEPDPVDDMAQGELTDIEPDVDDIMTEAYDAEPDADDRNLDPLVEAEVVELDSWDYSPLYAEGWSATRLMDAEVQSLMGEDIGQIQNLVIGPEGQILSVIAEVGGFWDIGDTLVSVPWTDIEVYDDMDIVRIPVTEGTIDDYALVETDYLDAASAARRIQQLGDDGLVLGDRAWAASELIGDQAFLTNQSDYGHVNDLIFDNGGSLQAVVVQDNQGYGDYYAYPYYGYDYGWQPQNDTYDLPYGTEEVGALDTFDYDAF